LRLNWDRLDNAIYDLTTNTLAIKFLEGAGDNLTVKINSANAAGIANIYGHGTNDQLVTSDAALDLSSYVSGFTVASTNATGTNFTVHHLHTGLHVAGGPGYDTITAQGFAFDIEGQRNFIFATTSVEKIIDASGTYTAPQIPNLFTLTTGPDTV